MYISEMMSNRHSSLRDQNQRNTRGRPDKRVIELQVRMKKYLARAEYVSIHTT